MDELIAIILNRAKGISARYDELQKLIAAPEIIADNALWRRYVKEQSDLSHAVFLYNQLTKAMAEQKRCEAELNTEKDNMLIGLLTEERQKQDEIINQTTEKLKNLLIGEEEETVVVLELKALEGALAMQLCSDLIDMYTKYAIRHNYRLKKDLYYTDNDNIKYAVIEIFGKNAFGALKFENGTHRILSKGVTATIAVTALPKHSYTPKTIDDKDIKVEVFHSGGAGGQNVNKVETAARAIHIPTNISSVCQDERSQLRNKQKAIKSLKTKVFDYYLKEQQKDEAKQKQANNNTAHRIRTYDYNKGKVFDHRINIINDLKFVLNGQIDNLLDTLILKEKKSKLSD